MAAFLDRHIEQFERTGLRDALTRLEISQDSAEDEDLKEDNGQVQISADSDDEDIDAEEMLVRNIAQFKRSWFSNRDNDGEDVGSPNSSSFFLARKE